MPKLLRKLIGSVVIFSVLFSVVAPGIVHAQLAAGEDGEARTVGSTNIRPQDIYEAIKAPTPNLANTTAYIFYTISVIMSGTFNDYENPAEASLPGQPRATKPSTLSDALGQRGMLGGLFFLIGETIRHQPASFNLYATDLARNSRFGAQPVYAQGIGFGALTPILGTWKAFRDVAYYLLTFMFLITGFLILIRHKIGGNMAVTVQNALPRLVLALILITFSYAIAGLIVDLMYLAIYFIINLFEARIFIKDTALVSRGILSDVTPRELALNTHLFTFTIRYILDGQAWNAASSVGDIVSSAVSGIPILNLVTDAPVVGPLFKWIINQIFAITFAVALFIAMFRVFFQLIMSYAGFVMNVVLSPLLLLEMTIPGRNPWQNWVKNLLAGLLPFVVTVFMIFMALALTGEGTQPGVGYDAGGTESGSVTSGLRLPFILSGINADAFMGVLAMGFMLLLPETIKISKDLVGAKGSLVDQYKDKAISNLKQGWQGNKYIPGAKQIMAGGVVGAGLGMVGGALAGSYAGGKAGQRIGGERGRGIGRVGGAIIGGLGGAVAAPLATFPAGAIVTAGGTPVFRGVKAVNKTITPYVAGADKALTSARDFALRQREKSRKTGIAGALEPNILKPDTGEDTPSSSEDLNNVA